MVAEQEQVSERKSRGRRILVVEDDEAMAVGLRDGLEYEGFEVVVAKDGAVGLRLATEAKPHLIILDLMLPKISGLDICKKIRSDDNRVPIIMLTARGQEIDKVLGLKAGADDYVTKPFSFMELMARVEAVMRRSGGAVAEVESFKFGDVSVSFKRSELKKGGEPVEISPRELKLLQYFVAHRGEVLGRDRLLEDVWGHDSSVFTRTVDMHIAKLRKKIEDSPSDPKHIITIHGAGYRFTS